MDVKIRAARKEDLPEIIELNKSLFEFDAKFDRTLDMDWPSKNGRKYFSGLISSRSSCLLVAESGRKVVGYLTGNIHQPAEYRKSMKLAEIDNMVVAKQFRKKGIGRLLVKEFLEWSKVRKASRVSVTASAANAAAINFYKDVGFDDYNATLEMELK